MGKYDDCIIYSESMDFPKGRPLPWIAKLDDLPVFQCSYSIHWNMPFDETKEPKPAPGQRIVGHPPHMHKENEIIFMFGSDPENPWDLGRRWRCASGLRWKSTSSPAAAACAYPAAPLTASTT